MMIMANEIKTEKKPKREINKWKMLSLILIVILCVSLFFLFGGGITGMAISGGLDPEEAADRAVDFINENLVQPGTSASFVSVEEVEGIYNVTVYYQEINIPVYVTKDGTYIFLSSPINMTEELAQPEETEQPEEVIKTDRPEAHAFVMSYCPYGLQFLKAYIPVIELLGDKADLEVNFVHYAMHDKKEIDENTRMYCIQKEQNDKFTDYLRCFVETDDWEGCVDQVGLDKTKLENCISSTDEQFKITELYNDQSTWSGNYPPYPVDATLANQYGVGGSPTFVLNDVTISVNRSPEAIKQAICSAFNTPPAECDQTLSTTTEEPGIGPIGSGSGSGSGSSGTC
jgi:protein-disulfide isomerase